MRCPSFALSGALVTALALGSPARAQASDLGNPRPLTETLTGGVLSDYETGRVLLSYHDDVGALVRFRRAYEQVHDARLLANMALCEDDLQQHARAATLYARALAEGEGLFTPDQANRLHELLAASRAAVARVHLAVSTPGAEIVLDGEVIGQSPLGSEVFVDIGTHHLRVTKSTYRTFERDIVVRAPGPLSVDAQLEVESHVGTLRIVSVDRSAIAIDDHVLGTGRWQGHVSAGSHEVRITAEGMDTYRKKVQVAENETRSLDVMLVPRHAPDAWLWAAGGTLAVITAITAAVSVFR
jgi:hypothetical protein